MCGRFTLKASPEELQSAFELSEIPADFRPRYNIAPTQEAAVIANREQPTPGLERFRWGLIPAWARDRTIANRLINARAETAAEKPSFRGALRRRRCLVLADGFYEWRSAAGARTPVWFHLEGEVPFAMAGLWERWQDPDGPSVHTFVILTTEANAAVAPVHHRMPVILDARHWDQWLQPAEVAAERLAHLLVPCESSRIRSRVVSPRVNSPHNEGPSCLMPAAGTLL